MASKKLPVVHVAVCGLTSSCFSGMSGQGAGKSCLCNRFVRPKRDDLCLNHSSIMTNSDFGSSVINNGHFLYWGEKIAALEDGSVAFQIVEHTEFVEDGNLQLYPFLKPYHKRCIQQKLLSGGKVQYLHPDQLAVPDEYTNVGRFPEKFVVDGYIICIDVSEDLDSPESQQREFLGRLLPAIMGVKRAHVVVAYTKFDIAKDAAVAAANDLLSKCKRQVPVIEVSALEGVNVDVCFLVLAHLVDSKRPRTRIQTFSAAHTHLKERIRKNEESFQAVLSSKITDFSLPLKGAQALLENEVEFLVLRELRGIKRVERLIKAQLNYLKEGVVKAKMVDFLDHLQPALQLFLADLSLTDTLESCKEKIRNHDKYLTYFMENPDWRDDVPLLKQEQLTRVPISILDEPEGKKVLRQHMGTVLAPQREKAACEAISTKLQNTPNLIPGCDMEDVVKELGLAEQLSAVSRQKALHIFQERMAQVEQECVSDIIELLLEHPHLFTLSEEVALSTINTQLKDDRRYQRLEQHTSSRMSAIIKHIGVMKWPDRSPFALSPILEAYTLLEHGAPSQEALSRLHGQSDQTDDTSSQSNWILDVDSRSFNLAVLGRTNENALTLRSDFMNHMSGSGLCEVHGGRYQMELAVYYGNITSLHTTNFLPQGAVAVVNSKECLIWLEGTLQSLWIQPYGDTPPPYRGLPLVILALDDSIMDTDASSVTVPNTPLCQRAKQLADMVQCVLMVERPTVQPKRLVLTSVITPLVSSLFDSVHSYADFLSCDLIYKPNALNVAVFTLAGDPYSPQDLLLPWLRHQAVCCDQKGSSLFVNCALERQHSIVNLTFHSSLNSLDVKKKVNAGFILVYSPHRQASFATLKHLTSQLPQIPILIVAMVTDTTCDSHVTEEGRKLAVQHGALFTATHSREWRVGYTCDFFTKCWFSRFSSWQTQNFNPKGNKDRPLPQPTADSHSSLHDLTDDISSSAPGPCPLPPRPPSSGSSRSQSPIRPHSMAGLLDTPPSTSAPPPPPSMTSSRSLPRPSRNKATGGKSREEQIYSDPVEIAMCNEQKRVTLQRRQERDQTLPRTPGSGTSLMSPSHALMLHIQNQTDNEDTSYADPRDIIKFAHNEPQPGASLPSPSVSPPPPPPASPPAANEDPLARRTAEELYDTVQPAGSRKTVVPSPVTSVKRYDRLANQVTGKYDRLLNTEGSPGDTGERLPAPLPNEASTDQPHPLPEYSTVQHNEKPEAMYATVNAGGKKKQNFTPDPWGRSTPPNNHSPIHNNTERTFGPPPTPQGEQMYSVVDKSRKKTKTVTIPVARGNGVHPEERKPIVPSPPSVARGNRGRVPPPVPPKPRSPVGPAINGGGGSPSEFSRRTLERQRKPTKPLVGTGTGHFRQMSDELSPTLPARTQSSEQLYPGQPQRHPVTPQNPTEELLYSLPIRRTKKPIVAPKPMTRRSPSPAALSPVADREAKSLPRGKSFDLDDHVARTSPPHVPRRVGSPQLERRHRHISPAGVHLTQVYTQHAYRLDPRMRTSSDPHFGQTIRDMRAGHRVTANVGKRAESSEDVWGRGDRVWSGAGDNGEEDSGGEPELPERKYSPVEMGLEDEPPPLPPRNYSWSDVEDNDEDLFQSEDELEEPSARISLDEQHAMYASLCLYQKRTNSISAIEDLYAIVNQVAREQETTRKPTSRPQQPVENEAANVYDTLESALKQKQQLQVRNEVTAAMKNSTATVETKTSQKATPQTPTHSALGALSGTQAAVFTPKQLKLIKQQQKLLDKLQKKTEREAERRRRSDARQRKREEGRRKGKKNKSVKELEQQRYFGSPLEKVVEADGVPRFIKQCTAIVEERGIRVEGIYRVSGKKDVCLALQDQYDMDSQVDVASLGLCETAITSTLKAFFKLLPEPLVSNKVAFAVLDINDGELSEQKRKLERILQQMPSPNLSTLRYLMLHLHRIQQLQDVNKMSSSNLAIVFWPTLMRPPLSDLADPSKQLCWQLMMARLIEHPDIVPEIC